MLRNFDLDLDMSKIGKDLKVQLALPNKKIIKNIKNITNASIDEVELNGLPIFTFEIPHKVEIVDFDTDNIEIVDNDDINNIKEEMLIKVTWYNGTKVNWFRVSDITKEENEENTFMVVESKSLPSELRATNVSINKESIDIIEYFETVLYQSPWKLGTVSDKLKNTYRSFDDDKKTRYEAVMSGIETFGAILDWDEENRILNLKSIDDIREFRGVVLKRENYASSVSVQSSSEEIVTRLYSYGNERLGIENSNPSGMPYIEDFSYFMSPFKRDGAKNVLSSSSYMSDELCHALLDLEDLKAEYNPKIQNLQNMINSAYTDLSRDMLALQEKQGQLITLQALLDTAKSTNDKDLIYQREMEIRDKELEISTLEENIENIEISIEEWDRQIFNFQQLISTSSFTTELIDELSLFVYEKEFNDDRYIDSQELYEASLEQMEKYQSPVKSFSIDLDSFINSLESQVFNGRLQIGEEVIIKSNKLNMEYRSIILGYNVDFESGHFELNISDNLDDISALDKLASIIYKAESSSTILNNNKYKWDGITSVVDEVSQWRDKEISTVENRITAGANESIVIDNRGIQAHNPDFPDERLIMQSGVIALSKDGGKTWNTSITPDGVIAETIIGKLFAGNNLIITNESGSFVIDSTGLNVNMDSIKIMSGSEGNPKDMIDLWNNLLLTYEEILDDGLITQHEKNQLQKQWSTIVDINSSMLEVFEKAWKDLEDSEPEDSPKPKPKPKEYNDYILAYSELDNYLNVTRQSDGYAILDKNNREETTQVDSIVFAQKFKNYNEKKTIFESIIPLEFSNGKIEVLENGISLTYTKNSEIITMLNLSEEGVRIDGKLLEINSRTEFNADLVMNAGVIKDKDNGIIIDLNVGEITLNKPIRINAGSNLVTKDDLEVLELEAYTVVLSNDNSFITTDKDGNNGDFSHAVSNVTVYKGATDDTSNWNITAVKSNGVVGALSGRTYTVTNMVGDSGKVIFTATHKSNSELSISKDFNIIKTKAGLDGDSGKDGIGIKSVKEYYAISTSNVTPPSLASDWSETPKTTDTTKKYLWNYEVYTYSNGDVKETTKRVIGTHGATGAQGPRGLQGAQGSQGNQGIQGPKGLDGKPSYTHIAYADTITGSGFSHNDAAKPFIGIYADSNPTSSETASKYTWSKWHGEDGSDGVQGPKGDNGQPSYTHFAYANNATGTSGFSTTDSLNKSYLGIYTDNIKADSSDPSKYAWTLIKGATGAQGPQGVQGLQGPQGNQGIKGDIGATGKSSYTHIAYATGDQGQSFNHSTFAQATHVGMYVSDNQNSSGNWRDYQWTLIRGRDGSQGIQGIKGTDGKTPYFHIAYANNSTGTSGFSINDSTNKLYIGTYTDFTEADSTDPSKYAWTLIKGDKGDTGATGKDGIAGKDGKGISSTTITYGLSTTDTVEPTSYTSNVPTLVKGRYLWTKTVWKYTDNTTETGYTKTYIAKDGNTGKDGIAGKDGVGISKTTITYAGSTSGTVTPTSGWNTAVPTVAEGNFLWTKTTWTYTDNSTEVGYSVAKMGAKGSTGATGNGITSVTNYYLATTLATGVTTATSGWTTTVQKTDSAKKYLWNYEEILYTNGKKIPTTPVIIGTHGEKGDKGDNAPLVKLSGATQIITQSNTGVRTPSASFTVVGTSVNTTISAWTYSVNGGTFGTGLPTGVTRSGNTVTVAPASITFNTLSIKATGGGVSDTFTIARIVDGEKGATGATGGTGSAGKDAYTVLLSNESHTFPAGTTNAVAGSTTTDIYAYKGTNKVAVTVGAITGMPTGMTGTITNNGTVNAKITFTVATNMTSPSGIVTMPLTVDGKIFNKEFSYALTFKGDTGATGAKGATGSQGPQGATGTSVSSVTEYYLATTLSTGVTTSTSGWSTSIQTMTATNKYLWNYEKINFSDGSNQPTIPVIIGVYGDKGGTGATGATGRSITGVTEYYLATSASSNVTRSTSGWTTTMQTTTSTNKYLWNYEKITWSSGTTTTYVEPIIIGVHGDRGPTGATGPKGDTGKDGIAGKDGKGIKSTVIAYATSTNGTTQPASGWGATVPSLTKGQYLWTRTIWTYTDSTTETGYSVSYIAKDGNNGTNGIAGKDGVGIKSTAITYAGSTSGTVKPTSGWNTAVPTVAQGSFLWTRTIWTYTDNTTETGYSVARMGSNGATGAKGPQGASATSYWITASNNIIGKSQTGVINPTTITFKGFSKTGTANSVAYSGRFIIQTSTNGTAYTTRYTTPSNTNESSCTYKIPANSLFVKCLFYMAGGTTVLLDEQTVPIVESAEGIQVGGRNLILNSYSLEMTGSDSGNRNITFDKGVHIITPTNNGNVYNTNVKPSVELVKGHEYTLSFDVLTNTAIGVYWYANTGGGAGSGGTIPDTKGDWIRHEFTYTQTRDSFKGGFLFGFHSLIAGSEVKYKNLKLEKGNKATDWTPAPEDVQSELDDKASNDYVEIAKTDLESSISITQESILTTVTERFTSQKEFEDYTEEITTRFEQTSKDFNFTFTELETIVNKMDTDSKTEFNELKKYIRLVDGNIYLGASDSSSELEITREAINFKQSGVIVADFTSQSFNIRRGAILESLQIGQHKFENMGNGHTVIRWIG